jgi:hypothetical protein
MQEVLISSKDMGWQTPPEFLDLVRKVGPIALDPCTTIKNPTGARRFATPEAEPTGDDGFFLTYPFGVVGLNGLGFPWRVWTQNHGLAFVNPPYGRALPGWIDKCIEEARLGAEIILLVPARTDTKWFQRVYPRADVTLLWSGRIKFIDAATGRQGDAAAFPSAVFYFGTRVGSFERAFTGRGLFVRR